FSTPPLPTTPSTPSLHDALPIYPTDSRATSWRPGRPHVNEASIETPLKILPASEHGFCEQFHLFQGGDRGRQEELVRPDLLEAQIEEHTSELQSPDQLVCRLLLE